MNELFRLFGTIAINNSDANRAIDDTTGRAEDSGSKLSSVFSNVGGIAVKVGATVVKATAAAATAAAAGIGAAATAVAAFSKQAVSAYADYEQLVGGIETLFNDTNLSLEDYAESVGKTVDDAFMEWSKLTRGARLVSNNADEAFRTAGLSANEYMETVTSFSASLIQSLKGDTFEAAKVADRAIIDMSDNANKMGTSMEGIMNAYKGFSKANFTMLDNLSLGYGGTKEEMERLIKDASKMKDVQDELNLSVKAGDMSFGNIVNAISVVQSKLGITGTTAREAASTISGSIGMLKASWTNFLTGAADAEQDFDILIDNLVESAITVVDNVVPRFVDTVPRMVQGLSQIAQNLAPYIPAILDQLTPALISGAISIISVLGTELPPLLLTLGNSLWEILLQAVGQIAGEGTVNEISDFFQKFISPMLDFEEAGTVFKKTWDSLVQPVIDFAIQYIDFVKEHSDEIMELLGDGISILSEQLQYYWESIISPILDGAGVLLKDFLDMVIENMPFILEQSQKAMNGIKEAWVSLQPELKQTADFLVDYVIPRVIFTFEKIILPTVKFVVNTVVSFISGTLIPTFKYFNEFISGAFSLDFEKAMEAIAKINNEILEGILGAFGLTFEDVEKTVMNAIDSIKGLFNFEWKLPDLKLPHFKMEGSFSLNPPSVPTIGIDWYAKAMNNPVIMDQPTAFGINAKGQIMAGGEKGSEVVSGTETLMNMISNAVSENNGELINVLYLILNAILSLDENMGSNLKDALEDTSLKIGSREFARLVKAVV